MSLKVSEVPQKRHWWNVAIFFAMVLPILAIAVRWYLVKDPVPSAKADYNVFLKMDRAATSATLVLQLSAFFLLGIATMKIRDRRVIPYWVALLAAVYIERYLLKPVLLT